jgi:hypothetical protein
VAGVGHASLGVGARSGIVQLSAIGRGFQIEGQSTSAGRDETGVESSVVVANGVNYSVDVRAQDRHAGPRVKSPSVGGCRLHGRVGDNAREEGRRTLLSMTCERRIVDSGLTGEVARRGQANTTTRVRDSLTMEEVVRGLHVVLIPSPSEALVIKVSNNEVPWREKRRRLSVTCPLHTSGDRLGRLRSFQPAFCEPSNWFWRPLRGVLELPFSPDMMFRIDGGRAQDERVVAGGR